MTYLGVSNGAVENWKGRERGEKMGEVRWVGLLSMAKLLSKKLTQKNQNPRVDVSAWSSSE